MREMEGAEDEDGAGLRGEQRLPGEQVFLLGFLFWGTFLKGTCCVVCFRDLPFLSLSPPSFPFFSVRGTVVLSFSFLS